MLKGRVIKAYKWAEERHTGQLRKYSSLPYFTHPKWVARTLEETGDEVLVMAGLVHDVLEDCKTHEWNKQKILDFIKNELGDEVAEISLELCNDKAEISKVGKTSYMVNKLRNLSYKATIVKLVDRLHNLLYMETDSTPYYFVKKYCLETKEMYHTWNLMEFKDKWRKKYFTMLGKVLDFYYIRYDNFKKDEKEDTLW